MRDKNVIKLHQTAYAQDVVSRYSHLLSDKKRQNRTDTPLPPGVKLSKEAEESETTRQKEYAARFPYQSVVGALMFRAVHTPGRTYPIRSNCSQGLASDRPMECAKRLSIH